MRTLTKIAYTAELHLACAELIGVVLVWIGLAMSFPPLIWVGAITIATEPIALFFSQPLNSSPIFEGPDPLEAIGTRYSFTFGQFLVGIVIYVIFDWSVLFELWGQLSSAPTEDRLSLLVSSSEEPIQYGLYSILWFKTVSGLLFSLIGSATQVLNNEIEKN